MAKRCIGIDVGPSHLRAVQVLQEAEGLCIDKVYSTKMRRSTDSPPDIIGSLITDHGFDAGAEVAISMPHNAVFFRNFEVDSTGLQRILELSQKSAGGEEHTAAGSVCEHGFPIEPDQTVVQVHSHRRLASEKHSVLTAAVAADKLRQRVQVLTETKKHPVLVDAPVFAVYSAVAVNYPEITTGTAIIAYLDESYLAFTVVQDNSILIVRNMPIAPVCSGDIGSFEERTARMLTHEIQITWRKLFGKDIEQDTTVYLVTVADVSDELEAAIEEGLRCQITKVDPYARIECVSQSNGGAKICLAEGLALRVLAPEQTAGVNFRDAGPEVTKTRVAVRKELAVCAVLAAGIALIWLVGLFIRLSRLEARHSRVENEIRQIFERTLPDEGNMVNPLAQLEHKLQALRGNYALSGYINTARTNPLEVLHAITTEGPSDQNIDIDSTLITAESVRLTGTAGSFDAVYKWREKLQQIPQFAAVDIQESIHKDPESGSVHFTILISLATPEQ
ncbi:MAG: PilN domain-containing protein [Planctomycetota bacterium]|jgi:hypothetical protein